MKTAIVGALLGGSMRFMGGHSADTDGDDVGGGDFGGGDFDV